MISVPATPEESLPTKIQHELLRFSQEAISNAVRHAEPTVVSVTLRWEPPNLILKVKDNGSGISSPRLEKSEGFGLGNMRTRASQIDGKLDIHTVSGRGTSIVLTVPIPSVKSYATSVTKVIRILIADDHPVVREGLVTILKSEKDIKVVAEAAEWKGNLRACRRAAPDVLLLDLRMPEKEWPAGYH